MYRACLRARAHARAQTRSRLRLWNGEKEEQRFDSDKNQIFVTTDRSEKSEVQYPCLGILSGLTRPERIIWHGYMRRRLRLDAVPSGRSRRLRLLLESGTASTADANPQLRREVTDW